LADVDVNPDDNKCMFMSCEYKEGQNRDIRQGKKSPKVPQISNI